tara:strand:- start:444 stop:584 length:141 start_codon:yes stop_codon:yes gene_type:complete
MSLGHESFIILKYGINPIKKINEKGFYKRKTSKNHEYFLQKPILNS